MNLDDLNEAPMGMLNKLGQKILSKVPGSIGSAAQGKLDTGRVANEWKKEYMQFLGRIGQKNPSTETLLGFLKSKKIEPEDAQTFVKEHMTVYERVLTGKEVDQMILKAAQFAASGTGKVRIEPDIDVPTSQAQTAAPAATPASAAKSVPKITAPAQKQTPDSGVNNYLNSWAKSIRTAVDSADKMKLAQEMIKFIGDRQGTPQGKMLAKAAEMVIKRLGDPQVAKVIGGLKKFQMERANYAVAAYMLSEMGLTWKDIGMKIVLSESTSEYVTIACR